MWVVSFFLAFGWPVPEMWAVLVIFFCCDILWFFNRADAPFSFVFRGGVVHFLFVLVGLGLFPAKLRSSKVV